QPDALSDTLEKVGFAQAEFYYDQVDPKHLYWDDYKDEALWNMRWRARLRRFHTPTQTSLGALAGLIGSVSGVPALLSGGFVADAATALGGSVDKVVIH